MNKKVKEKNTHGGARAGAGAKKKKAKDKKQTFSACLSPAMLKKLDVIAQKNDLSRSGVIEELVERSGVVLS